MSKEPTYAVYWPRATRTLSLKPVAPRIDSLQGKTVAFLWDYIFRGDEIFAILEKELRARFPNMRFIGQDVFGNIHGPDERQVVAALPEKLKSFGVDAVIAGMAC